MLQTRLRSDPELGSLSPFLFLLLPKSYADPDRKEAGLRNVRDSPCLVRSDMISPSAWAWEGSEEHQFDRNCKGAVIKLLAFIACILEIKTYTGRVAVARQGGGRVILQETVEETADICFASPGNLECCLNSTQDAFASILGRI